MPQFVKDIETIIRAVVENATPPEEKFKLLNMLEDAIQKIREDTAAEWTYCANCHQYVKVSERKIINNEDGTYNVACGNCGGFHYVNKKS